MSLPRAIELLAGDGGEAEARSVARRILHDAAGSYKEGAKVLGISPRHFLGVVQALGMTEVAREMSSLAARRFRLTG